MRRSEVFRKAASIIILHNSRCLFLPKMPNLREMGEKSCFFLQ